MRILICDDDLPAAEQLQTCLQQFFSKNKLKSPDIVIYPDGESLLADQNPKDIVFLDIEMPGLSGIFVGNELKKQTKTSLYLLSLLMSNIWMMQCVSMFSAIFLNLWKSTVFSAI